MYNYLEISSKQIGIIFFGILGFLLIVAVVLTILTNIWGKKVIKTSEYIKELEDINNKYNFFTINKAEYEFRYRCNKKSEYDRFNYQSFLESKIEKQEGMFRELIDEIDTNIKMNEDYSNEYDELESNITKDIAAQYNVPYRFYINSENNWKKNHKQHPTVDIKIIIKCNYRSPGGQKEYHNVKNFNFKNLKSSYNSFIKDRDEREKTQNRIRIERSKMTASLRYDVMRRDGFKCQICGASAKDGVKLHVDHIIPVSKGGETIPSNLRTLCDRCNLGKSDKIE